MGMYTEIYVNVDFKEDTPQNIIDVVEAVCEGDMEFINSKELPQRWSYLFGNGSYYTPHTSVADLSYNRFSKQYSLIGKGDIKNYCNEIEKFFEFIKPHVENNFMGYSMFEEAVEPTLHYVTDPNNTED